MLNEILGWRPTRSWLVIPPVLLGIACVVGFEMSQKALPRVTPVERALPLPVMQLQFSGLTPWATGFGTAAPSRTWTAVTEVEGRIIEVHPSLDSGTRVTRGELLLKIDDFDYQLRLNQRLADLKSMKANLVQLEASVVADQKSLQLAQELVAVAEADLQRKQQLRKSNAVSVSEVDEARGNVLQQTQSVQTLANSLTLYPSKIASADANVTLAESQVEEAQREIDRTTIRSPFDGVISGVKLEAGQIVGHNQRLFEIQDDHLIEVEAQFSLTQLEKVSPRLRDRISSLSPTSSLNAADADLLEGLTARVVVRSGDLAHRWTGKAVRISESVDEQTRTLGIVIQVSNSEPRAVDHPGIESQTGVPTSHIKLASAERPLEHAATEPTRPTLRTGSFCEVTLFGRPIAGAIVIPRTAIDGDVVYVIDENDRLRARPITIGFAIGEQVTVTAGLIEGDRIATAYPSPAIEGKLIDAKIQPKKPTQAKHASGP